MPDANDQPGEQLRERVRATEGLSVRYLSAAIGANHGWLSDYLHGRIRWLSPRMRQGLEAQFRLPCGALSTRPLPNVPPMSSVERWSPGRVIPVYSSSMTAGVLTVDRERRIAVVPDVAGAERLWATRAQDDPATRLRVRAGEMLYVSDARPAGEGNTVLITIRGPAGNGRDGVLLRRYVGRGAHGGIVAATFQDRPKLLRIRMNRVLSVEPIVCIGIR
jgi:hypothetical protein